MLTVYQQNKLWVNCGWFVLSLGNGIKNVKKKIFNHMNNYVDKIKVKINL